MKLLPAQSCASFQPSKWNPIKCNNCLQFHQSSSPSSSTPSSPTSPTRSIVDQEQAPYSNTPNNTYNHIDICRLNETASSPQTCQLELPNNSNNLVGQTPQLTLLTRHKSSLILKSVAVLYIDDQDNTTYTKMLSIRSHCKGFERNQWRPKICVHCFNAIDAHSPSEYTLQHVTEESISTPSTPISKPPRPSFLASSLTPRSRKISHASLLAVVPEPNNIPPQRYTQLTPRQSHCISPTHYEVLPTPQTPVRLLGEPSIPSTPLIITPPTSSQATAPQTPSSSSQVISMAPQTLSLPQTKNKRSSVQITISTSTSSSSLTDPAPATSRSSTSILSKETSTDSLLSTTTMTTTTSGGAATSSDSDGSRTTTTMTTTTTRMPKIDLPLPLLKLKLLPPVVLIEDDPFKDFDELSDQPNKTTTTLTTTISTTKEEEGKTETSTSSTTTILCSPRNIDAVKSTMTTQTTTTSSSLSPSLVSQRRTRSPLPGRRLSARIDKYKESDSQDDWDQGMDLSSFLKQKNRIKDLSYCSNKIMEISSVKEEAQRQSIDFGGGIHPIAFEAFKDILVAKETQIKRAMSMNKIDESDCSMLVDQLNEAKDLLDKLLDQLNNLNSLAVRQRTRGKWWEALCGVTHENEYKVFTPANQHFLTAREHTSNCQLCFCGKMRKFKMSVCDLEGHELLKLRQLEVFLGEASAQPGKYLGRVKERFSCCLPVLNVFDETGAEVYRIIGECCGCSNYNLSIRQGNGSGDEWGDDGTEVGEINKVWSGAVKELFTDADNFYIQFPPDANSSRKSLLLGALFLVDYLFFEGKDAERSFV
eukprot:gene8011-9411_t